MISKVTKSNKALFEARREQINAALAASGSPTRVTDFESYFGNIREIQALATNFIGSASGDSAEGTPGKFLLMPLDEPLFEIDANKRVISIPSEFNKNGIGVRGDHMAETLYFKIDRYFDHQDLFQVDEIIINWQFRPANASRNADFPMHTSLAFAPDEEYLPGYVVFGWVIGDFQDENGEWVRMTPSKGTLNFSIGFVKKEDNKYQYALNTTVASVNVNDSLFLEDPSILTMLKRPVFERLSDSRYTEAGAEQAHDPIWRSGKEELDENKEKVRKGLYPIANFELNPDGSESNEILLTAVGAVTDQAGIDIKYDWSGTSFATGTAIEGRDRNSESVETDWVPTEDLEAKEGIVYYIKQGNNFIPLSNSSTPTLAEAFDPDGTYATVTKYELGSSLEVTEGGAYHVDMQAVKVTSQSGGENVISKSRSVNSIECIVPHAAIPVVTLTVNGVPKEGLGNTPGYEIADPDIASQYIFVGDDSPSVKAIVTKSEKNIISRTTLDNIEVAVNKLLTVNQNDGNTVQSQENQDNITVIQRGNIISIVGSLADLNEFESTDGNQGSGKWIGLDISTNVPDITQLKWNNYQLTDWDVQDAASVGLGAGHIVFWAKAENLPTVVRITRENFGEAELTFMFIDGDEYVDTPDEEMDREKALENARKGIIKESSLGKIAFAVAKDGEDPNFADAEWVRYDSAAKFDINNNASIEGDYCVYVMNERNHTQSLSEPSNAIKVSKIAPILNNISVFVKEENTNKDLKLVENNQTVLVTDSDTGTTNPKSYLMGVNGAIGTIVIGDSFDSFKDPVSLTLKVKEIDKTIWTNSHEIVNVAETAAGQSDEYSVNAQNQFIIPGIDSGTFVVEAVTEYNGVKRTTYTEPFYLTNL